MADVVLDALQLLQEPKLLERRLELLVPLAMERAGLAAPLVRAALGDVARDDAFAGQQR